MIMDGYGNVKEIVESKKENIIGGFPPWTINVFPFADTNKHAREPCLDDKTYSDIHEIKIKRFWGISGRTNQIETKG